MHVAEGRCSPYPTSTTARATVSQKAAVGFSRSVVIGHQSLSSRPA